MSETVEDVLAKGGQDTDPAEENFGTGCSSCTAAASGIPSGTVPPALGIRHNSLNVCHPSGRRRLIVTEPRRDDGAGESGLRQGPDAALSHHLGVNPFSEQRGTLLAAVAAPAARGGRRV
jgi:hypothetical protein